MNEKVNSEFEFKKDDDLKKMNFDKKQRVIFSLKIRL